MTKLSRVFALLLALSLLLSAGFAETADETAEERTLLMTLGGIPVYRDRVAYYSDLTYMYYNYGLLDYYYDPLDALQYTIYFDVASVLLTEGRVEELLGDSYDDLAMTYGADFDGFVDEQMAEIKAEEGFSGTDEEAYEQALQYFADGGYTRDTYIEERLTSEAYNVFLENIAAEVSDEAIEAEFFARAEQDRETFEGHVGMYDYYVMYFGDESYYIPEGYRGVLHILLAADEALLAAYDEAEEGEAKQQAAEAVIASVQDTIDEIYAAYEAGTPFVELIEKYNIDPGMQSAENLATGYLVHPEGILYMEEFTKGAFSEGMDEPGDISQPIVTSYGVHILYYLSDIPGGVIDLTDEIRASIREDLVSEARYQQIIDLLKQYEVVYYPAYDEYIGEKNFLDD